MEFFLSNRQYTLSYRIYGSGPRILLAFHGFGRSGEDFRIFGPLLGREFTIYAFDLPYHGKATTGDILRYPVFTKNDLHGLIDKFCSEKNINRFSLMGYSLGGKIALGCLEVFKEKVENIYLLAPDGLKVNPFYFIGTRTWLGRWIFESIIKKPQPLFNLGNLLERMGWINPKINYFVRYHMDTESRRKRVFDVWMIFRKFIPNLRKITAIINENDTSILLFFGKYDNVIPPRLADKIVPGLKNKNVLHVLDCGHRVMERGVEISKQIINNLNPF